jgi:hypothetical protein
MSVSAQHKQIIDCHAHTPTMQVTYVNNAFTVAGLRGCMRYTIERHTHDWIMERGTSVSNAAIAYAHKDKHADKLYRLLVLCNT